MTGDFSRRLTSRFCHDLANPLGAIANGIELLQMGDMPPSPEMALIEDSLTQAKGQLALFRLAFGGAKNAIEARVEAGDTLAKTWNSVARSKVEMGAGLSLTGLDVKLIALSLMCLENTLLSGGAVMITPQAGGITLHGTARKLVYREEFWSLLDPNTPHQTEIEPSRLHFLALAAELQNQTRTLQITHSETEITLQLSA